MKNDEILRRLNEEYQLPERVVTRQKSGYITSQRGRRLLKITVEGTVIGRKKEKE